MKLHHQTEVAASSDDVWDFLQDTRAVARCLPGAELVDAFGDDRYQGVLRLAIGPLKMNYAGDVTVVERNTGDRSIVLDATGRDKRGSGAVQAHVRLQVSPVDQRARIDVVSDLDLTGRIASLGRGVRDVSNRMFVEFTEQLVDRVEHPDGSAPRATAARSGGARPAASPEPAPAVPRASAGGPHTGASSGSRQARSRPQRPSSGAASEIKLLPLVWSVTRERIADLLDRMSERVRPR